MLIASHTKTIRSGGFTMVEMMVTVLIASILLVIAVPSYTYQMRHSRRTEAKTALLDLAAREERYFSTNSAYTTNLANLGYAGTGWPITVGSGYYTLSVSSSSTTQFTGTATATGPQAGDTACLNFTIDNTGVLSATSATGCW